MTSDNDQSWPPAPIGGGNGLTEEMDALIHRALAVCGALKANIARQGAGEAFKNCASQLYQLADQLANVTEKAKNRLQAVPDTQNEERQLLEASWKFHYNVVRRIIEDINSLIVTNINREFGQGSILN